MAAKKKTRGKGEGALFKDGRGLWTAVVELPPLNGKRRRRTIRSKDKGVVARKLRDLQFELERSGDLPTHDMSVEQWMHEWFTTIALAKIRPKTADTYRGLIRREIIPALGKIRLDKLTPADVRHMNLAMVEKGLSSSTAMQVHRILAVALKYAERDGKVRRNVATLTDAPRRAIPNTKALTLDEGIRVLERCAVEPMGTLWAAVLLTGARQGELLGLQRDRVHRRLDISWQLQQLTWQHGCAGKCNRKRGTDCPDRTIRHPVDWEHQYLTRTLWLARPKSVSGKRIIPLVEPLASELAQHLTTTADEVNPFNLVWHKDDGSPLDGHQISREWHEMLDRAGVTDVRFHDGRHTTVDLLLAAGVPLDIITEIVGHTARATTEMYKTRGNEVRLTEAMTNMSALVIRPGDGRSETLALGA